MRRHPPHRARFRFAARAVARLLWCASGAALGLGIVFWFVNPPDTPLLLASFGGTAVFLFGLTRASAVQPRSLFGGHLGSAFIGVCCYQLLGDATWVYVLALVLSLVFMLVTKTVHPPAGANPLLMLHGHAGFGTVLHPVGLGVAILALVAMGWSRLLPGTVRYPIHWWEKSPPSMFWGAWVE